MRVKNTYKEFQKNKWGGKILIEEKNKMEVLNNDIIFKNIFNVKETIKRLLE